MCQAGPSCELQGFHGVLLACIPQTKESVHRSRHPLLPLTPADRIPGRQARFSNAAGLRRVVAFTPEGNASVSVAITVQ